MKERWMKDDEEWMKNEWRMNEEWMKHIVWWFQAVEGFCWETNGHMWV